MEYDIKQGFYYGKYSYEDAVNLRKKIDNYTKYKDIKEYIANNSIQIIISQKDEKEKQDKAKSEIKIEQDNKVNDFDTKGDINISSDEKEKLIEYLTEKIKKDYDEKINSLKISLKIEYEEKYAELIKDKDESKKSFEEKIKKIKKLHEFDINSLKRTMLKNKNDLKIKIKNEKERYNKLMKKYDASSIYKAPTNVNQSKEKEILKLSNDNKDLNTKIDTICCRVLSKFIIDFLYFTFTSCLKGLSYLE